MTQDQYYFFTGPDGFAWTECWIDGKYFVLPTPFRSVKEAVEFQRSHNPEAIVDTLCLASDISGAWAKAERMMAGEDVGDW